MPTTAKGVTVFLSLNLKLFIIPGCITLGVKGKKISLEILSFDLSSKVLACTGDELELIDF